MPNLFTERNIAVLLIIVHLDSILGTSLDGRHASLPY